MKTGIRTLFIVSYSFIYCTSYSQNEDSVRNKLLAAARDIINNTTTCALITQDEKGIPKVRTMDPFAPGDDFSIWLATNPKSRKVVEIKNNPHVTLYYADKENQGYVTIRGTAQLVNDQKEKDQRWKEAWRNFYPDRKESYLLIKVTPEKLEVINYRKGISGDKLTWGPSSVEFGLKK
jgi:general stress protein 26